MLTYNCDDIVTALQDAEVDHRTGNKVLYSVSWTADRDSMIGKRNEDWVRRELDWFMSGSNRLQDMEAPVPQAFLACAGPDGVVNSAYGHILFGVSEDVPDGVYSLAENIVQALVREGLGTRHAVAIISDRDIHRLATKNGRKDFICTNALNIMVDTDNKLHIIAQMRSMDAVWGYRADWSMWDSLMDWLIMRLEAQPEFAEIIIERGNITFQVANLHVYPRHFDMLSKEADIVYDRQERMARALWAKRLLAKQ